MKQRKKSWKFGREGLPFKTRGSGKGPFSARYVSREESR